MISVIGIIMRGLVYALGYLIQLGASYLYEKVLVESMYIEIGCQNYYGVYYRK